MVFPMECPRVEPRRTKPFPPIYHRQREIFNHGFRIALCRYDAQALENYSLLYQCAQVGTMFSDLNRLFKVSPALAISHQDWAKRSCYASDISPSWKG